MPGDPIPVEQYVYNIFQTTRVNQIIAEWRVEPTKLRDLVCAHLRETGLFFAHPDHRKIIDEAVQYILVNSKEIRSLVQSTEREENDKRRSRHADA